jgi:hypothetical protein
MTARRQPGRMFGRAGRRWPAAGALLLAAALVAGCGPPKPRLVDFSETPRNFRGKDYRAVYDLWTRHDKLLYGTASALEVWVTYKSWEFREAFIEHYADVYGLPAADRSSLRASQLEAAREGYEFFVTAQTGQFEWNDLDKKSSAWRISLIDGAGREILPESVEPPHLPDAFITEFFPDRTPFSRSYVVHFVAPVAGSDFGGAHTGRLTLAIASPLGRANLTWQSRP